VIAHGIRAKRRLAECDGDEQGGRSAAIVVSLEERRLDLDAVRDRLGKAIMIARRSQ
jgi:hypothetical protein